MWVNKWTLERQWFPQKYTEQTDFAILHKRTFDSLLSLIIARSSGNVLLQCATHTHSHRQRFYSTRSLACSLGRSPVSYHSRCISTQEISLNGLRMNKWTGIGYTQAHAHRKIAHTKTRQLNTIQCSTNKHLTKPPLSLSSTTTTTIRTSDNNSNNNRALSTHRERRRWRQRHTICKCQKM